YAVQNGLPDPNKMGEYFIDYLGTDAAQTLLSDGIASMVNTDGIQSQISGALQGYVQEAMGAYASAIGQTLETQITSAMTQILNQLAQAMAEQMEQAMSQLGANMENA